MGPLRIGMRGTVLGPASNVKPFMPKNQACVGVTVGFESTGRIPWNMFPTQISRTKHGPEDIKLPGGFKVGDMVYSLITYNQHGDGMRGTVVGLGMTEGTLSVQFGSTCSSRTEVKPKYINLAGSRVPRSCMDLPGGFRTGDVDYSLRGRKKKRLSAGMRGTVVVNVFISRLEDLDESQPSDSDSGVSMQNEMPVVDLTVTEDLAALPESPKGEAPIRKISEDPGRERSPSESRRAVGKAPKIRQTLGPLLGQ